MSAPAKRTPRLAPEQRRREILDATLALAADEGFDAVTIDAVAQGVGHHAARRLRPLRRPRRAARGAGRTRGGARPGRAGRRSSRPAAARRTTRRRPARGAGCVPPGGARRPADVAARPASPRRARRPSCASASSATATAIRAHLRDLLEWGLDEAWRAAGRRHRAAGPHARRRWRRTPRRMVLAQPRRYTPDRLVAFAARGPRRPSRSERVSRRALRHRAPTSPSAASRCSTRRWRSSRRKGWRAVSMEAIAREVGVTRPVVYRAYPNLALVLAALLRREQQPRTRRARRRGAQRMPGRQGPLRGAATTACTRSSPPCRRSPATWRRHPAPRRGHAVGRRSARSCAAVRRSRSASRR